MKRSWVNSPYAFSLGMFAMMVPSQAFSSFYSYFYVDKLGLGIGLAMVGGNIIDEDAEKTGQRREGIYTAVSGFITRSSGLISALAFFIVGLIFGYESGDNPGSDPESTFRYLISVIPLCLLLLSFLISFATKIEFKNGMGGAVDHGKKTDYKL